MESDARMAEYAAAIFMREIGYPDATPTKASGDNGIDVYSTEAVAQVKWHSKPVGRPDIQSLVGSASVIHDGKALLFFSRVGFSRDATEFADRMGIRLFESDRSGGGGDRFLASNSLAADLLCGYRVESSEADESVLLDVKFNTPEEWIRSPFPDSRPPTVRLRTADGSFARPLVSAPQRAQRIVEEICRVELPRALNTWKFHEKTPNDTGSWVALIVGLASRSDPQFVKFVTGPFDTTNCRLLVEALNKLKWNSAFVKWAEPSNYFGHCSLRSGVSAEFIGRVEAPKLKGECISFSGGLRFSVVK